MDFLGAAAWFAPVGGMVGAGALVGVSVADAVGAGAAVSVAGAAGVMGVGVCGMQPDRK